MLNKPKNHRDYYTDDDWMVKLSHFSNNTAAKISYPTAKNVYFYKTGHDMQLWLP